MLSRGGFRENVHFVPMMRQCGFCQVNFDAIGHLETFEEDSEFIRRSIEAHSGLEHFYWSTERTHSSSGGQAKLDRYLKELNKTQMQTFFDYYKRDFEAFGYEAERHFDLLIEK